jgi:small GTP-binding protein
VTQVENSQERFTFTNIEPLSPTGDVLYRLNFNRLVVVPLREFAKPVLIGSSGVGKTCLSSRSQGKDFNQIYQATIGAGYSVYSTKLDGKPFELQIWNTAGTEHYRELGSIYSRGASCPVFVYDASRPESAADIPRWYEAFCECASEPVYSIVVANKADLVGETTIEAQMRQWADDHGFEFLITSSRTVLNVTKLFNTAAASLTCAFDAPLVPTRPKSECCGRIIDKQILSLIPSHRSHRSATAEGGPQPSGSPHLIFAFKRDRVFKNC